MAISVELDLMDGHSAVLTENGWEITRIALVKGLSGSASSRLINSVNSAEVIAAGMPEIYDSHPDKSGAKLREIRPQIIDSETVKCVLIYRANGVVNFPPESKSVISVGSSVQQVETNIDKAGADLFVEHTWSLNDYKKFVDKTATSIPTDWPDTGKSGLDKQGGSVSVFVPQTVYEYSRKQSYSPENDAMDYVNKVNSGSWKGGAAGTWLCTSITGRSYDDGDTYDCTYSFQYNANGWNPVYVYLLPDGKPPPTTDESSKKTADYYETANFGGLPI